MFNVLPPYGRYAKIHSYLESVKTLTFINKKSRDLASTGLPLINTPKKRISYELLPEASTVNTILLLLYVLMNTCSGVL